MCSAKPQPVCPRPLERPRQPGSKDDGDQLPKAFGVSHTHKKQRRQRTRLPPWQVSPGTFASVASFVQRSTPNSMAVAPATASGSFRCFHKKGGLCENQYLCVDAGIACVCQLRHQTDDCYNYDNCNPSKAGGHAGRRRQMDAQQERRLGIDLGPSGMVALTTGGSPPMALNPPSTSVDLSRISPAIR
jgi:hypothetical protein